MKAVDIETELGVRIIRDLRNNGWDLIDQYDKNAFDKGIDFDSYILSKEDRQLEFEWSNWFEWQIVGDLDEIKSLSTIHSLKLVDRK